MATQDYCALLNRARQKKLHQVLSSANISHQDKAMQDVIHATKKYKDPVGAAYVLGEYAQELRDRGLFDNDLLHDLRQFRDAVTLESYLSGLIAMHDGLESRPLSVGVIPYMLGDDLKPVNHEEHQANKPEETLGSHSHVTRNPSFSGSRCSSR